MTDGFDFDAWLTEAHDGLNVLREKREGLVTEKERIEQDLVSTDAEIVALESMLKAHGGVVPNEPQETPVARVTGVKKAIAAIADELTIGVEWTEDQIVTMAQEKVTGAREKSCRSAIQALAKDGVFIQTGQRGAWVYSTTTGKIPGEEPQDAPEPKAEPEAPEPEAAAPAQEGTQEAQDETPEPEVIVAGIPEVIAALTKEMKARKSFAMGEKNIGWIAADLHCEPKTVRDALKTMIEGDYEFAYDGEVKVLRPKAEPGSKEELKRTSISDTPLFKDADRPPHA